MSETVWRRRHLLEPSCRASYLALAVPGGAAAEATVEAPAGTSHLLEHLLYRQNDLAGNPLDSLGGRLGLETGSETMVGVFAFAPGDLPEVARLVEGWWERFRVEPSHLAEEAQVVAQELLQVGGGTGRLLWSHLARLVYPGTHLSRDFTGDTALLWPLTPAEVEGHQRRIRALGAALAVVGPRSPWPDPLATASPVPWLPPPVPLAPEATRVVLTNPDVARATILAGIPIDGMTGEAAVGSHALAACLRFGRLHPGQIRFHRELRLRHLDFDLRMYAGAGVLTALAHAPLELADDVSELIEGILSTVAEVTEGDRLRRATLHDLAARRDAPQLRCEEEAKRLLFGAPGLDDLLERARAMSPVEFERAARSAVRGSPSTVLLTRD